MMMAGMLGAPPPPVGGKKGDWICPSCGNLCYASKSTCFKCGTPKSEEQVLAESRPGDWLCGGCHHRNFCKRQTCNKCGGSVAGGKRLKMKPGDYICAGCNDCVYAAKSACSTCGTPRPNAGN